MQLRWIALAVLFAFLALPTAVAGAMDSIAVQGERATAQYWTERTADGDALLLTPAEITAVNQEIRQPNSWLTDLAKYPETVSADSIREKIMTVMWDYADESLPELYKNGKRLTQYSFDFAKKNCNLDAIPAMQTVRYAVAAQRTDMRLLPEAAGWLNSTDELDSHYDNLQGTAVDPAEPMAVLAESYDHQFVFALTRNYMGWVPMGAIAFTDRKHWMEYVAPKNFLVVTANKKKVP
ncbi:MAG: SH3 domain-containing protein, partial [Selenomonadaceae bacterium]|nr:SH3 domain-containing protein [Selenomonadaceae bacterium]